METDIIQCQVCQRVPSDKLPFYCHRCARNVVYEPRLTLAQSLLEKESAGKDIEQAIRASKNGKVDEPRLENSADLARRLTYDSARSEYRLIAARTQSILDDSRHLQEEVEQMRTQLAELKTGTAKRKRSIKSASQDLQYEEDTAVKPLQEKITTIQSSWDRVHKRIVSGRHVLPRELTSLCGLQVRRRRKGTSSRDAYTIVGIPVFNLKELNTARPEHLNASTAQIAQLIHVAAHYLGLRLPAEISLATAGQPFTYIHPPMSSYKAPTLSFGSRDLSQTKSVPRKRVLWLEKSLPQLASEDSQAYSLYLDAIILLAWDVAWVTKTQGIDVGGNGWEDICLVGKNLYDLFGGPSMEPEDQQKTSDTNEPTGDADVKPHPCSSSQASAHSFLNSAGAGGLAEYMKAWRYSTPTKIIETIKSALMNERMGADWEVLERPEEEANAQENNG